tara:strand:+ start:2751 stop:2957 length:207 start_codon:yes stop_codon:yes gene_type:complete
MPYHTPKIKKVRDPNYMLGGSNDISFNNGLSNVNRKKKPQMKNGLNTSPIAKNTYSNINYINRNIYDL